MYLVSKLRIQIKFSNTQWKNKYMNNNLWGVGIIMIYSLDGFDLIKNYK